MDKIILGDSRDVLREMSAESIDCIVTSPPYKDADGYSYQLINSVFSECYRVLKKNSLCFVNFGHLAEEKSRPFRFAIQLEDKIGFNLSETFVWVKNHFRPIQGSRRVNNLTEFVFMFYKGKMPQIDRLSIGVPYVDKSNAKRWKSVGGRDLRCGGNVWHIPYETVTASKDKLHNDRFPLGLPERCIKLAGLKPGQVVLDPFFGSGTTGEAAKSLGVGYIGIEKEKHHYKTSLIRINHLGF